MEESILAEKKGTESQQNKTLAYLDNKKMLVWQSATFGYSLIHKESLQGAAGNTQYLIWKFFAPDALPNTTPKRFVSPPGIDPQIFKMDCNVDASTGSATRYLYYKAWFGSQRYVQV